jgi:hypothetical protein
VSQGGIADDRYFNGLRISFRQRAGMVI